MLGLLSVSEGRRHKAEMAGLTKGCQPGRWSGPRSGSGLNRANHRLRDLPCQMFQGISLQPETLKYVVKQVAVSWFWAESCSFDFKVVKKLQRHNRKRAGLGFWSVYESRQWAEHCRKDHMWWDCGEPGGPLQPDPICQWDSWKLRQRKFPSSVALPHTTAGPRAVFRACSWHAEGNLYT